MPKQTHKYCRYPGKNRGFYWINGKRVLLPGLYNSTESKQAYFEAMVEINKAKAVEIVGKKKPQPISIKLTIAELVAKFLEHGETYYRKNGKITPRYKTYEVASRPLVEFYGDWKVDRFTQTQLFELQKLLDKRDDLSRGTVNGYITCVKKFFGWGVERGFVSCEVAGKLAYVKSLEEGRCNSYDLPDVEPVSWEVVKATLPFLQPVVRDMVLIQWFTGIRSDDVINLMWSQIDTSDDVWIYDLGKLHKTAHWGITRYIPLYKKCQAVLERCKDTPEDAIIFSPKRTMREKAERLAAKRKTKVQPSQIKRKLYKQIRTDSLVNDAYRADTYRSAIQRGAQKAGVENWFPSQIKHSYTTHVANKLGEKDAQTVRGHTNINTTRIYIHEDLEKIEKIKAIARKLEQE